MTIVSLGILVLVFGASCFWAGRPIGVKAIKALFMTAVVAVFSLLSYYSYQQYVVWAAAEPLKFLLPPYQSIDYFIKYIGYRLFAPYLVSLILSAVFFRVARALNKKYEERFFEIEEPWLGAIALFLTGWPGALFYFTGLILIYLIVHSSLAISRKSSFKETRVSLYYWWLPLAIFVIMLNKWLVGLDLWKLLKI
jgi:hypothetical protein